MKRWFAFGKIRDTEELLTMKVVENDPVEIAPGVTVRRTGMNRWEFLSGGQSLDVDLTLGEGEEYETPFDLGSGSIRREYFSVIHIGEGDGWDPAKPCMGSIVCFQGRLYLIDAGPNILESLTALGISVNEIEGIFQTHCHDDHFAGLTSLVRSDRRLRYFAVPAVRATVEKKMGALMGIDSLRFARLFDVQDLTADEWNPVDGLDVRPLFSSHPVETTVLFFRAHGEEGTKTYAHLADLPSSAVLDEMVTDDPTKDGISAEARDRFLREVRARMDIKKVDAGRRPYPRGAGGLRFRHLEEDHPEPHRLHAHRRPEGDRVQRGVRPERRADPCPSAGICPAIRESLPWHLFPGRPSRRAGNAPELPYRLLQRRVHLHQEGDGDSRHFPDSQRHRGGH